VDALGLESGDVRILRALCERWTAKPVGLNPLARYLGVTPKSITAREGYLARAGLVIGGERGRVATREAYRQLGLKPPVFLPKGAD
jgi:Holliday junction DNA helicase RuvB